MLSLLILIIIIWNFYIGYNRGILLQFFYFLGAIVSLFVAKQYYQSLASKMNLWIPYSNPAEGAKTLFFTDVNIFKLDLVYYAGFAFLLIAIISYAFIRLIGVLLHIAPIDKWDQPKFNSIAGILSIVTTLIFLTLIFSVLATIPMAVIQEQLYNHFLTRFLINHFQPMSSIIRTLWIDSIL